MASILSSLVLLQLLSSQVFGVIPMPISTRPVPFNGTNPLFADRSGFQHSVTLTYRSAHSVFGPVCGHPIEVGGSVLPVDVASSPAVYANQVRVQPVVTITEPPFTSGGMYTLLLAIQPQEEMEFGSPTKPIIHWMESDIEVGPASNPLTLSSFIPFAPHDKDGYLAVVLLYQQNSNRRLENASVIPYVDNECVGGPGRCSFDVERFANDSRLTLVFANTMRILPDKYSYALHASLPFVEHGCYYLAKYMMRANVLLGDKVDELKFALTARFVTPEEVAGPVCSRAFHYKADDVTINWDVGQPVPARKVRTVPWVEYSKKGEDMSWKDDWYTLAYVSQITDWPAGGSPEKPMLLWLVTNIHGNDVSGGKCDVPYLAASPESDSQSMVFLLYKQMRKVDINPADFSETDCPRQYRCTFNVNRMADENELKLVGALTFKIGTDPLTISKFFENELLTEPQTCALLRPFSHEGKLLGECLPKFPSWADLWKQFQKMKEEKEKHMMKSKLSEMCPELGHDFSKDKPFHEEKPMGGEKDKGDEYKKFFIKMLMEKMFEKGDKKDDKMGEDKDGGCGKELIHQMMKMKMMWAMKEMKDWDDTEKEFGPCMKAVAGHLKALHEQYSAKNKKEEDMMEMKEKFPQFMKEKFEGFVKHMVMSKISQHLGMDSCGDKDEAGSKPCANPEKIKMFLWHKYVQMKEKKQEDHQSMEQKQEGNVEEMKKQFKEMMFFKSLMSMMDEKKKENKTSKTDEPFPLIAHFLKNNAHWRKFCEDW